MKEVGINKQEMKNDSQKIPNLLLSSKKEIEVILLFPRGKEHGKIPPYAQTILSYGLKNLGISHRIYDKDNWIDPAEILYDKNKFQIFARSACHEHIPTVIEWNQWLDREIQEHSLSLIGWQATVDKETRNYLLQSGLDAVSPGHAQLFFGYMKRLQQLEYIDRPIALDHAKWILATLALQKVPEGKFPDFEKFPLMSCRTREWEEEKATDKVNSVIIPHYQNCPNHCDFCSLMKVSKNKVSESIAKVISEVKKPIPEISFNGPTFAGDIVKSFRKIVKATKEVQWYTPETSMVMDSKQFQEHEYKKTLKLVKEFNIKSIRLWLNAIDWDIARAVGRRDCGKIRTNDEIQQEKTWILKFLQEESIERFWIDMLLTPFDTPATIEAILSFYKEILTISRQKNINAVMYLYPLVPYPGTRFSKKYRKNINLQNYGQLSGSGENALDIRKFDEELFGLRCLRAQQRAFEVFIKHIPDDEARGADLCFLSLSMAYQYIQGKQSLEEMEFPDPIYREDPVVNLMFRKMKIGDMEDKAKKTK